MLSREEFCRGTVVYGHSVTQVAGAHTRTSMQVPKLALFEHPHLA